MTLIIETGVDAEMVMMNSIYKERLPKAAQQMEERLERFISDNLELEGVHASDAVTRFVHHQVLGSFPCLMYPILTLTICNLLTCHVE